jgi:putative intracellular protease/amidase
MSVTVDITRDRKILLLASNPTTSALTGWPIGFWWSELTHPYWTLTEAGYHVDVVSPDGGHLAGDGYSDPTDASGYSADDLISLGFMSSPAHRELIENSKAIKDVNPADYDALLVIGGQGPMYTFYNDERVHQLVASNYEAGRITAAICHGTCVLLKAKKKDGRAKSMPLLFTTALHNNNYRTRCTMRYLISSHTFRLPTKRSKHIARWYDYGVTPGRRELDSE